MKPILALIIAVLLSGNLSAQGIITIDSSRSYPVGDTVTITGIITNGSELGTIRYIQDGTAGIGLYDYDVIYFQRGDSVTITGEMDEYNQLLEIANIYNDTVHTSSNPLPVPQLITPVILGEPYEGEIVRINNATFNNPGGVFSGNTNYMMTSSGSQFAVRVNTASPLVGANIPVNAVDIIGIASQFDYANPTAGYQILLRDSADIISASNIMFTSPVSVYNITQTGFDLDWTTDSTGTTEIYYGGSQSLGQHKTTPGLTLNHTISITGASPSELFYIRAFSVRGGDTAFSGIKSFITQSASSGDIKVYFTSTVDHTVSNGVNAIQLDNALDDTLIAYIDRADTTIDFAIYNFNTQNISNITTALNDAHSRGVRVRVVNDGSSNNTGLSNLDTAIGMISSPLSSEYGIMHNKFVVIDGAVNDPNVPTVWTGSMNWTSQGINQYANNVIIIQDKSLAKAYTIEFEEMFGSAGAKPNASNALFGPYKFNNTPHEFIINGKRVECYFSPSDGVNQKIIDNINTGDNEIFVNTMLITRSDIGYALRDQYLNGLDVKVLINHKNECSSTVVSTLEGSLDSNFRQFAEPYILHHKLMIVDPNYPSLDPLVLTGCHNWSNSADQRNDENTLVIHDSTIANIYYQEFSQRWKMTEPGAGINKLESTNDLLFIYPNPAKDQITIQLSDHITGDCNIKMINLSGQILLKKEENIKSGGFSVEFNQKIKPGIYIIQVEADDKILTSRIAVIH